MSLYYITKKESETGKKFAEIKARADKAFQQQREIVKSLGAQKWRSGKWCAFGGFSSLFFEETPCSQTYKKVAAGEYYPKRNTKKGKLVLEILQSCERVTYTELNACIGFKDPFLHIGFNSLSDEYFGFIADENFLEFGMEVPIDCKEITFSEYKKIFNQ